MRVAMLKRAVAVSAVNVIVLCVVAELVSLAVFYYQHGWLFYLYPYRQTHELIPETQNQQLTGDRLHPYFGPTHQAGIPFDIPESLRTAQSPRVATNNFGFASARDYPFAKKSHQFVIGIFGGSVGLWFCHVGAHRLIEDLKRQTFFKDKELVSLCLSHEGYKQPQQLLVLSYFLSIGQQFDAVVNIDGFNEVALASVNNQRGSDISMPSAVHLDPLVNLIAPSTLTPEKLESLTAISRYKQRLYRLAKSIDESRLASIHLVLEQYYASVDRRYRNELAVFDKLPPNPPDRSIIRVTPKLRDREGTALFEDIAREWITSSTLMRELLAARGVAYFHFLQPNQYYTTRAFSREEARVALSDESPYKKSVEQGYPFLVREAVSRTAKSGSVSVLDGTRIFDREPSPVYVDNCCHYTLVGNEILADFIAKTILDSKGAWR